MLTICIILAIAVLALSWGVNTTAKRNRFLAEKCKAQENELAELRWENAQLRNKNSGAGKYDHGGYPGH